MAKVITVQDYKHTKLMLMEVHVYSSVNAKCQAVSIWDKDIMTSQKAKAKRKWARDLKTWCILPENSAEGLRSRREHCWGHESIYENRPKKLLHLPPKSYGNFS